ncbi:MAG: hypothetical protein AAB630_03140 [Patescibacteria group bacterium]
MPIGTGSEGKFYGSEAHERCLAEHFARAVKDVCCMSDDATQIIIGALIGEYVREDPNKDVLEYTKKLFIVMKKFTQADVFVLDAPEWQGAVEEIKRKLLFSLPYEVVRRYQGDIDTFFQRLEWYGISKLEKAHSSEV